MAQTGWLPVVKSPINRRAPVSALGREHRGDPRAGRTLCYSRVGTASAQRNTWCKDLGVRTNLAPGSRMRKQL